MMSRSSCNVLLAYFNAQPFCVTACRTTSMSSFKASSACSRAHPLCLTAANTHSPWRYSQTFLVGPQALFMVISYIFSTCSSRRSETFYFEQIWKILYFAQNIFFKAGFGILRLRNNAKLIAEDFFPGYDPPALQKHSKITFSRQKLTCFVNSFCFQKCLQNSSKITEFCQSDTTDTCALKLRTRSTRSHQKQMKLGPSYPRIMKQKKKQNASEQNQVFSRASGTLCDHFLHMFNLF